MFGELKARLSSVKKRIIVRRTVRSMFGELTVCPIKNGLKITQPNIHILTENIDQYPYTTHETTQPNTRAHSDKKMTHPYTPHLFGNTARTRHLSPTTKLTRAHKPYMSVTT